MTKEELLQHIAVCKLKGVPAYIKLHFPGESYEHMHKEVLEVDGVRVFIRDFSSRTEMGIGTHREIKNIGTRAINIDEVLRLGFLPND